MDLNKELLLDHSKSNTLRIAALIGTDPKRFDCLVQIMIRADAKVAARGAWVFRCCVDKHPWLFTEKHAGACIRRLRRPACDAVKRNIIAVLQTAKIPEGEEGILVNHCFNLLNGRNEPIAVKVFSMTVLYRLAVKYPDLQNELVASILEQWPQASAGFRNRATKILNKLRQPPPVTNPI